MNPGSRAGRSSRKFRKVFALMNEYGLDYDHAVTQSLDHAYNLSCEVNRKGYEAVIAMGGDGTINAVINGFFDQSGNRISQARFGVIYTGTSPDFCKSYQIPTDLRKAIQHLKEYKTRDIPIGMIRMGGNRYLNPSSQYVGRKVQFFGCCANVGLGAALAKRANAGIRRFLGDFLGTFTALLITIIRFKANTFIREVDGKLEHVDCMYNTSVGITPYIASGIQVSNEKPDSVGFYCLTVTNIKLHNFLPLMRKVYSGRPIFNTAYLSLLWCNRVVFAENAANPEVEFDGDPAGFLPCTIELAPMKLQLIC